MMLGSFCFFVSLVFLQPEMAEQPNGRMASSFILFVVFKVILDENFVQILYFKIFLLQILYDLL